MIGFAEFFSKFIFGRIDNQFRSFGENQILDGDKIRVSEIQTAGFENNLLFFPCEMNPVRGHI